ncbi:unnamed protein product [Discula destructiva]
MLWFSLDVGARACLLLGLFAANISAQDFAARNLATVQAVYNQTVYPLNTVAIKTQGQSVAALFDPEARGRITPLGNFTGALDSIEYFYGLAPAPQTNPGGLGIYEAEVVEFTSGCPEVASSLVYLKTGPVNNVTGGLIPGSEVTILKQMAFWRFNATGAVQLYEAFIPTLQLWTTVSTGVDLSVGIYQAGLIAVQLCPAIQQGCTGVDQVYSGITDCSAQLLAKTFGTFDEVWGDNVVCRQIHVLLTASRPDIHCPHVGPTGGMKCVDIDYKKEYFDDQELFGMDKPFLCT